LGDDPLEGEDRSAAAEAATILRATTDPFPLQAGVRTALLALVLLVWATPGRAEDLTGRWQVGGGLSFVAVMDNLRSNAAFVVLDQPGIDGIPNSGDEPILFADPRPDVLQARETTLQDGLALNLNASYGFSKWFSLQIETGFFRSDVVQFDTYGLLSRYVDNGDGLLIFQSSGPPVFGCGCVTEERSIPQSISFTAATVTQVPVGLSTVFRFLTRQPLNLNLSVGGAYIFVDTRESEQFRELSRSIADAEMVRLASQLIPPQSVGTGDAIEDMFLLASEPDIPPLEPLAIEFGNTTQWHVGFGMDYFFTSHWSLDLEARWVFVKDNLRVNVSGSDQLNYSFRSPANLPRCEDLTPNPLPIGLDPAFTGLAEVCRPGEAPDLVDDILVQGGEIDLSGPSLRIGIRYSF
jgi:hypothetical protein